MDERESPTVPSVVSLVLCDQVIDDRLSDKKSAIGIFNTVLVPQFPAVINQMAILASVTEISGRADVELRLVRDSDNAVLFSGHGPVEAPNPLAVVDLLFAIHGVRIPEPGQYAYEIVCQQAILARRRFQVLSRPPARPEIKPPPPPGPYSIG